MIIMRIIFFYLKLAILLPLITQAIEIPQNSENHQGKVVDDPNKLMPLTKDRHKKKEEFKDAAIQKIESTMEVVKNLPAYSYCTKK